MFRFVLPCLALTLTLRAAPELAVSTSLPLTREGLPALAFDGKEDTAFRSARPVADGDDWRVDLPADARVTRVEVRTGAPEGGGALALGVLEFSDDGEQFRHAAVFADGRAAADAGPGLRAFRIRATGGDGAPLVVREVVLAGLAEAPAVTLRTRVFTHTETVPQTREFAERAKALVQEWYPRLIRDFHHPGASAPRQEIHLYFQNMEGVAHAANGAIHISADWVTKKSPKDYGMVVHELFHIVQDYRGGGEGWLTEGLADYVRHALYEPTVPMGPPDPAKASYRDAYTTTARFLIWCEQKWPGLAHTLNAASRTRQPVRPLFAQASGKELDALWADYVADRDWSFPAKK